MRILITGKSGQVAMSIAERLREETLFFAARPDFDLTDAESVQRAVDRIEPDIIVSAAAYTAVDKAEDEPEVAMAINGLGPGVLAKAAAQHGIPILHLSTDYVFDGTLDRPWREDDPVNPLGVYGATKLAGERAVQDSGAEHAILRTAWVYSPFGGNFVKTMLRVAESRRDVRVVEDQFGCPTSALDIADAIGAMIARWKQGDHTPWESIYHMAGTGSTHWAEFARAIFAESEKRAGPVAQVIDIPSSDYPTRAARPANSRLDCTRFETMFDLRLPPWRASLAVVVERLLTTKTPSGIR
jgi:dTDP-4-dehydrorhamnose reductase